MIIIFDNISHDNTTCYRGSRRRKGRRGLKMYLKKSWLKTPRTWRRKHIQVQRNKSESQVARSCSTLCEPMDCSLPGSSVHGIFQAIVLEWIAISFSRGCSWPRDQTQVSRIVDRCFTVWATREVSGLLFPSQGDLPDPGIKPEFPILQADTLLSESPIPPNNSVQFSSVTQSCLTLCDPMNCSMPGLPVHHHLPKFTQAHVHRVRLLNHKRNKIMTFETI